METLKAHKPDEFADLATQWCDKKTVEYQAKRVFLPSGGTPKSLYKKWEEQRPAFLRHLEFTQLDEVITGPHAGSFREFFKSHLPTYFEQFIPLDEQHAMPDLVVLGLGINGHVGFHEPHVRKDFFKGVVELSAETCERMGDPPGIKALSYGVECFMRAKAVLLLIQGPNKERVTREFFENPDAKFPAAFLRSHPDLTVIVAS